MAASLTDPPMGLVAELPPARLATQSRVPQGRVEPQAGPGLTTPAQTPRVLAD